MTNSAKNFLNRELICSRFFFNFCNKKQPIHINRLFKYTLTGVFISIVFSQVICNIIFGQAVSRVLYQTIIYLGLLSPAGSSDPPTRTATGSRLLCPLSVLLRMGFTRPVCYHTAGELLPHHFNLATAKLFRRYVSVALSLRLPSPDVIWHSRPVEPGLSSRLNGPRLSACPNNIRFF